MAIKRAQYNIYNESSQEEAYYFETDAKSVKVLDKDNNIVGDLGELAFSGKTVTSGSFKDLKITGFYKIKNLTGLPDTYVKDKTAILQVVAIGEINNPELVYYTFIGENGEIAQTVVKDGLQESWTTGGKNLAEIIDSFEKNIGSISDLKTADKGSLVNAINEVYNISIQNKNDITEINKKLKEHNHDERYLKLDGTSSMNGDLVLNNNLSLKMNTPQGEKRVIIKYSMVDGVSVGDGKVPVDIKAKDGQFTVNGKLVWNGDNDGKGSGLDADKLDGLDSSAFAQLNLENKFTKNQSLTDSSIKFISDISGDGIEWAKKDGSNRGAIRSGSNGSIDILTNGNNYLSIDSRGWVKTKTGVKLTSTGGPSDETCVYFALTEDDPGMGLYRNKRSQYLGIYDWKNQKKIAHFSQIDQQAYFDEPINIEGRRLWLQAGTPTGSHNVGDIWIS